MPINEALFPVEPNLTLSPDVISWPEAIVDQLSSKYPALSSLIGEVVFSKVNKIDGDAIGYVTLIGRQQRIPFIIDDKELNPCDIYIDGMSYFPLNEQSVEKLVSRMWPFKLVPEAERQTITKVATVLAATDHVDEDFVSKNKETLIKIAQENPELLQNLVVKADSVNKENQILDIFIKEASSDEPITVQDLKVGFSTNYSMTKFAADFGKEALQAVMSGQELRLTNFEPFNKLNILEDYQYEKVAAAPTPSIMIQDSFGQPIQGKILPLRDLNLTPESSKAIFISTDGKSKFKIARTFRAVKHSISSHGDLKSSSPKISDTAVVVFNNEAYGPFDIKGIQILDGEKIYTVIQNSETFYIKQIFGIKKPVTLNNKTLGIPDCASILPIHQLNDYNETLVKFAEVNVNVSKLTNGKYKVNDNGVTGINPKTLQELNQRDAVTSLMHAGLSESEAKFALAKTKKESVYNFPATTQVDNTKIAENNIDEKSEEVAKIVREYAEKGGLLKFAAHNDKSNIDLALGLNLVTPLTVKRFALLIPELTKLLDSLCKLLVMKRLNRQTITIDEGDITSSIKSLHNIVVSLGSL